MSFLCRWVLWWPSRLINSESEVIGDDGKTTRVPVQTGLFAGDRVEVASDDLHEGQRMSGAKPMSSLLEVREVRRSYGSPPVNACPMG